MERRIAVEGREPLRLLLQGWIDARSAETPPRDVVGADGRDRTHHRAAVRELETVLGTVEVRRDRVGGRGLEALAPLDARLNLTADRFSFGVRERAAAEAIGGSFDDAVDALSATTGATVSKRQAEELVRAAAADFDGFYDAPRRGRWRGGSSGSARPDDGREGRGDARGVAASGDPGRCEEGEAQAPETTVQRGEAEPKAHGDGRLRVQPGPGGAHGRRHRWGPRPHVVYASPSQGVREAGLGVAGEGAARRDRGDVRRGGPSRPVSRAALGRARGRQRDADRRTAPRSEDGRRQAHAGARRDPRHRVPLVCSLGRLHGGGPKGRSLGAREASRGAEGAREHRGRRDAPIGDDEEADVASEHRQGSRLPAQPRGHAALRPVPQETGCRSPPG